MVDIRIDSTEEGQLMTGNNGNADSVVNWIALVSRVIYPIKVLIIEAIRWIDRPMSATELELVFGETMSLSNISHHVTTLAELGILKQVRKRRVRGAWEKFYFFTDAVRCHVKASSGVRRGRPAGRPLI